MSGIGRLRATRGGGITLARSGGWAIAEYLAFPVMMLAATPLYLWALGTIQYGQWMLLLTFTGFGGLAGLGMGPTATWAVAGARGRNDFAAAREGARVCLSITVLSSIFLVVLLTTLGLLFGTRWFSRVGSPETIHLIVLFAAYLLTLEQLDSVFAGVLRGLERFDMSARFEITAKIVQVLATAVVAWQSRSVVAVFATMTIVATGRTMAKFLAAQRFLELHAFTPKWHPAAMREAFVFGKWIWLQNAGSLMFAVVDRALIGSLLGAEALARYAVALQLTQQIQMIPSAGAQTLFPAVTRRREAGEDWRPLALRATLIVGAFGLLGAVIVLLAGPRFMEFWVGARMADALVPVLPWLVLAYALVALASGPHHIFMGIGRARFMAVLTLVAGIAAVAATPWAIQHFGFVGAPLGRILYGLVVLLAVPALVHAMRQKIGRTVT